MPLTGGERTLVDLARHVDVAPDSVGLAGPELPDILIAARQLQRALPVHAAGLPRALVKQAGPVEVGAVPFDPPVADCAAILSEDG